jgi:hypothetical protein
MLTHCQFDRLADVIPFDTRRRIAEGFSQHIELFDPTPLRASQIPG